MRRVGGESDGAEDKCKPKGKAQFCNSGATGVNGLSVDMLDLPFASMPHEVRLL